MGARWDQAQEARAVAAVRDLVGAPAGGETRAWRVFVAEVAGHLERWAARAPALRRAGLDGEDDARAVLVAVLERLAQHGYKNLHDFVARQEASAGEARRAVPDEIDASEVEELAAFARADAARPDGKAAASDGDLNEGTPLRGWLLALVRFAAKDHVKERLGWRSTARAVFVVVAPAGPGAAAAFERALAAVPGVEAAEVHDSELTVTYRAAQLREEALIAAIEKAGAKVAGRAPGPRSKREVQSGAAPLDAAPEAGERPGLTDLMTLRRVAGEMRAFMRGFPEDMRTALEAWLGDASFEEIAAALGSSPDEARKLVRAAQARLRERFRGEWPDLFGRA